MSKHPLSQPPQSNESMEEYLDVYQNLKNYSKI